MPTENKSSLLWLWILLGVGGAVLAAVLVCGGIGFIAFRNAKNAAQQEAVERPIMKREDFRTAVMGKTPDEVIAAVGKPDSTSDSGSGKLYWYYNYRTVDPVTGKTDNSAQLVFKNGRVATVNF